MPKSAKKEPSAEGGMSFEEALEALEDLVRQMEAEEVPLNDLLQKYEEGNRYYKVCESRLDEARGRIEILRKKRNGESVLEPFGGDDEGGSRRNDDAEDDEPDHDGELF